jgi:hypothetical protein
MKTMPRVFQSVTSVTSTFPMHKPWVLLLIPPGLVPFRVSQADVFPNDDERDYDDYLDDQCESLSAPRHQYQLGPAAMIMII